MLSCKGDLNLVKSSELIDQDYPEFNFNFRYYTFNSDSLSLAKNDSIKIGSKCYIELYINQIEFKKENTTYTFSCIKPIDLDFNLVYDNLAYRANDPIPVKYDKFKKNIIIIQFNPLNTGMADLQFNCTDSGNHVKSFSKRITVY